MNSLITNESELTQEDILKFINPLSFPGMHYLCKPCEVDHISTQLNCTINVEEPDTEIELETEPAETTTVSESTAEIPSSNTPNEQIIINSASNDNASSTSPALETASKTTIQIPATCRFYKKSSCRHGSKGEECRFNHPELCKKFIQHGTRQPRGCKNGTKCKFLHPQMCMNSLRKGKCLTQNCKFRHIKGTTRHETDGKAKVSSPTEASNLSQSQQTADETKNKNAPEQVLNNNHFLDAIRLLKAELLSEMDKRLDKVAGAQPVQPRQQQILYYPQQLPPNQPPQPTQLPQQIPHQQKQTFIKHPQELLNPQTWIPPQFLPPAAMMINKPTLYQQPLSLPITQTQQIPQQTTLHPNPQQ